MYYIPAGNVRFAETGGIEMKAHILIVDDDSRITDLLRRILAYEGYSVAIAASGSEALNRSLERPPDR